MEPVTLEGLPENPVRPIDSAPIIYVLEDNREFAAVLRPVFEAHAQCLARFAATTTTLAQVLTGTLADRNEVPAERYRSTLGSWFVVGLDAEIAESAARLRASSKLKLAGAVQAASALTIGADALITHDRDWRLGVGIQDLRKPLKPKAN